MTTRRTVCIGLAALSISSPAFAHRSNRSETEVVINPDGSVDVTHVYHAHDAQEVLYSAGIIDRRNISRLRARAQLALYSAQHFSLSSNGIPGSFSVIGAELIGSKVYVYQSGTIENPDDKLVVSASMLRELVSDHVNSVSIKRNGTVATIDFRKDDGPKAVA